MRAVRLKTEYMTEPCGIDIVKPRLFWNCHGGRKQTAYRIMAEDDNGISLWDSGRVESSSMHASWGGRPVPMKTKVTWRICLWDENGDPGDWQEAGFETGIDCWQAGWITGNYRVDKRKRYPVDCFRKKFTVSHVKKARLYITACGLYEARFNGVRAGDFVLAPGHTDYRKRVQYQTIDVTGLLTDGENVLTVQLADGWYRGSCGAWGLKNQYGTETKLLAQLEITGADGSTETICTDGTWDWSNDGPIRFADNQDGEVYDGEAVPVYGGKARVTEHNVTPTASNNVPVREQERFSARLQKTPSGKTLLDFGQNIAGYLEFSVRARAGQKIRLRFGEMLGGDGEFTQKNIQCSNRKTTTPLQQVIYTCREGRNDYKTTFAIFGFRYVLVEGDAAVCPEDYTAIAVYSHMERTGWFESSNHLLNRLFDCTLWSAKSNHADLPTDCPTRERHGWAGDAQIFCRTAGFLFDYAAFARKYQHDLTDAQHENGCFTQIAPVGGVDAYMNPMDGSPGWSDAGVFIPYEIFRQYGDSAILEENYEAMVRYARYKIRSLGRWYPTAVPVKAAGKYRSCISNYGQSYGEWAEPEDVNAFRISDFISPHPEETTAYIVLLLERMTQIARVLGREEDAAYFQKYAERARLGYQRLVETKKHGLDTDRQAKLVRPLYMRLLDEKQTEYAQRRLLKALDNYGWRLGTGFLSTPLILYVLSNMNIEYAYRLLENEELPGWLCMPKMGAVTVWENWEGTQADKPASLNHYSKGAVCQWLVGTMCGIRVEGENHFVIVPGPGGHFTYAKAVYDSIYGRVESGWERTEEGIEYRIAIPANCTAEILLPDGTSRTVTAGSYCLK